MRQTYRPGWEPMGWLVQAGSVEAEAYFTEWSIDVPINSTFESLILYSLRCVRPSWGGILVIWLRLVGEGWLMEEELYVDGGVWERV